MSPWPIKTAPKSQKEYIVVFLSVIHGGMSMPKIICEKKVKSPRATEHELGTVCNFFSRKRSFDGTFLKSD